MQGALLATWDVIQGLILIGLCVVVYQVVKLQGRLLLRLDELERALARSGDEGQGTQAGLAVGTPISAFRLPDLEGREFSPDDFRGKRTLLVHWSFDCGFCELLAPDLARMQGDLLARGVQLVLAGRDDAATNRARAAEYGLECPILLVDDESPLMGEAFRRQGTPVAYLLDEQGRVARPLAVGGDAILDLAREAPADRPGRVRLPNERPLSQSRIERNGLKAGTPAPLFRLPEVRGGTVALEDYRGRRVLLVFTDPNCGPCEDLAPHLARLDREHRDDGPALILVARGDAEEARRKADHHGFAFPVVVQERWNLSREYGIFVVPVAFLIDEEGVIADDVARGVDEILALAPRGLAAGKA